MISPKLMVVFDGSNLFSVSSSIVGTGGIFVWGFRASVCNGFVHGLEVEEDMRFSGVCSIFFAVDVTAVVFWTWIWFIALGLVEGVEPGSIGMSVVFGMGDTTVGKGRSGKRLAPGVAGSWDLGSVATGVIGNVKIVLGGGVKYASGVKIRGRSNMP